MSEKLGKIARVLGLDVGLQSIGWAIVDVNKDSIEGSVIVDAGARIYPAGEQHKGESPAKPRREARSQRRRLQRRQLRLKEIRRLFVKQGLLTKNSASGAGLAKLHLSQNARKNAWQLRSSGLAERLDEKEWAVVLIHLAKRRGYKSNRKTGSQDESEKEESGKVLVALKKNQNLLEKKNQNLPEKKGRYTMGAMLYENKQAGSPIRNRAREETKNGKQVKVPTYGNIITREDTEHEIRELFKKQRCFGNKHAGEGFEEAYLGIWGRQRPFDQGQIGSMVGSCTFEPKEKRAPKEAFSAEYSRILQRINNVELRRYSNGERKRLVEKFPDARNVILGMAMKNKEVKFSQVRKELKLSCCWRFKDIFYKDEKKQLEKNIETIDISLAEESLKAFAGKTKNCEDITKGLAIPDCFKIISSEPSVKVEFPSESEKINKEFVKKHFRFRLLKKSLGQMLLRFLEKAENQDRLAYSDARALLEMPPAMIFSRCKREQEEKKDFFSLQLRRVEKAVVKKMGEHKWQHIDEQSKTLLLHAGKYGLDADDRKNFLRENSADETLIDVAAEIKKIPEKGTEKNSKGEEDILLAMPGWHKFEQAFKETAVWQKLQDIKQPQNVDLLDKLAALAAFHKDEKVFCKAIEAKSFQDSFPQITSSDWQEIKQAGLELEISGFGGLSFAALRKINPHLREGLNYSDACAKAGYNHSKPQKEAKIQTGLPAFYKSPEEPDKEKLVVDPTEIRNPRVVRSLSQARKVVNAIMHKHGPVHKVHIELLRDLANNAGDRYKIVQGQKDFLSRKKDAENLFREIFPGKEPKGGELLKFRLWKEQAGRSPYSGKYLEPERLREDGYVQVDHILPFSRSMDNSQTNMVLCLTKENQEKSNRIPFEWFEQDENKNEQDWQNFVKRTASYRIGRREKLLRKSFTKAEAEEYREKWVEGAESKWIARELKHVLETHLTFAPSDEGVQVQTRNGALTGFLRAQWGLHKDRDDDRHHAVDAMVLALATQSMVKKVMEWSKAKEIWASDSKNAEKAETVDEETGEIHPSTYKQQKWFGSKLIRNKILDQKRIIVVSQASSCKFSGEAHAAGISSMKTESDASIDPLAQVRGGKPNSWKILRTDIFEKNGKFFCSVVRPYHYIHGQMPDTFAGSAQEKINDTYNFKFSLFPGDAVLIKAKGKKELKGKFPPDKDCAGVLWKESNNAVYIMGYFRSTHAGKGQIVIEAHDRSWGKEGDYHPGIRSLLGLEKISVPILGNVDLQEIIDPKKKKFIVKKERRNELEKHSDNKKS